MGCRLRKHESRGFVHRFLQYHIFKNLSTHRGQTLTFVFFRNNSLFSRLFLLFLKLQNNVAIELKYSRTGNIIKQCQRALILAGF